MVKQWENSKDDNYSNNQICFGNFTFSGSCKEDNVQASLHENEVANYVKALTAIETSNNYMDHVKPKKLTQYSIKKGVKEFPEGQTICYQGNG